MKTKVKVMIAVVSLIILAAAVESYRLNTGIIYDQNMHVLMKGKPAPNLKLPMLGPSDQAIDTNSLLQHKVTVITIWASWCADCSERLRNLTLLQKKYRSRVNFIGIAYKDERDKARTWIKRTPNPFSTNLYDPDGKSATEYWLIGIPYSVIIDAKGNFVGWFVDEPRILDDYMRSLKADL